MGDALSSSSSAAAARWAAAGEAMAWESSIHEHAAWRARRAAWEAKAVADDAAGAAGESAADAHGRAVAGAAERAAGGMSQAAALMRESAREFMRASEMKEAAGDAKIRSSAAHGRAAESERAQIMREWAEDSYKSALGDARMAAAVADDAKGIVMDAERLAAGAAKRAPDTPILGDGEAVTAAWLVGAWENARHNRTKPAEMAALAKEGEKAAEKIRNMEATVAEKAAGAAERAAESRVRAGADEEEAAAAWEEAMSSAGRADKGGGAGRRAADKAGGGRIAGARRPVRAAAAATGRMRGAQSEGGRIAEGGSREPGARGGAAGPGGDLRIDRRGSGVGGASPAAAALWEAAADAMMWEASIRDHAAWAKRRKGWAARSEADDAIGRVAEAFGRSIDAQGRVDAEAMGRVVGMLKDAAKASDLAAGAFMRSADLSKAAGKKQLQAAKACRVAADPERDASMTELSMRSYDYARTATDLGSSAIGWAKALLLDYIRLEGSSGLWSSAGYRWDSGRGALPSVQAGAREDAGPERMLQAAAEGQAEETARLSSEIRKMSAGAFKRSAAWADGEAARGQADPDVQRAAAAWRKAAASAGRAGRRKKGGRRRQAAAAPA